MLHSIFKEQKHRTLEIYQFHKMLFETHQHFLEKIRIRGTMVL